MQEEGLLGQLNQSKYDQMIVNKASVDSRWVNVCGVGVRAKSKLNHRIRKGPEEPEFSKSRGGDHNSTEKKVSKLDMTTDKTVGCDGVYGEVG